MSSAPQSGPPQFVESVVVDAPAARVMQAFVAHRDLAYWWQIERSVVVARPSAPFAVSWSAGDKDDVLGVLGGTLHGTVMDYTPDRVLFVADVYWQPPESEPLGPMALEITCQPEPDPAKTRVTVRQSASEDGPRWRRYFTLTQRGWADGLAMLKDYIENEWLYRVKTIKDQR